MTQKTNFKKPVTIIAIVLIIFSTFSYAVPTATFYKPFMHSSIAGSPGDMNTQGAFNIGLFTGAATYYYPIDVPLGTNGLQPSLSISYNSQATSGKPGIIGAAWSITESYIERDINYTMSDTFDDSFKLVLNGEGHDLIFDSSGDRWYTKIESYLYIKNQTGGNNDKNQYWVLKTKDGTTYRLGYNQDSEQLSNQEDYVSRWYIDLVTDTHGNNIYYSYRENPISGEYGATYPYRIEYNNDKSRVIEFVLEPSDRPDIRNVYEQGNQVIQKRRVSEIKVSADDNLVRKYGLEYQIIDVNTKSFLNGISIYGNDGASLLSSTSFTYNPVDKGWQEDTTWDIPFTFSGTRDQGIRAGDVNRDGYVDIIKGYKGDEDDDPEETEVWMNTKTGWEKDTSKNFPYSFVRTVRIYACRDSYWQYGVDRGFRLLDVNSDGFMDLMVVPHGDFMGSIDRNIDKATYLGDGDSWTTDPSWTPSVDQVVGWEDEYDFCVRFYGADMGARFIDLNGDGLVDIVKRSSYGQYDGVWINKGSGWERSSNWVLPRTITYQRHISRGECPRQYGIDYGSRLIDINGDGLTDMVVSNEEKEEVYINNGKEFIRDDSWNVPFKFIDDQWWDDICFTKLGVDNGVRFADLNNDGLVDILRSKSGSRAAWINNGNGWTQDDSWNVPIDFVNWEGENQGVRILDVDADGLVDVVQARNDKKIWMNKASGAYLLGEISNDMGGKVTIDYEKSTSYDNTGDDSLSDLGFNMWVVSSMTMDNGLSGVSHVSATTAYDYQGGLYDYGDREFRGFSYVEETRPDGSKIKHQFHQDDAKKGLENRTEIIDSDGNPYEKTENEFSSEQINGYHIVTLDSTKGYVYDGVAENPKVVQTDFDYDDYGNAVRTASLGDISVSGDERYSYVDYTYNTAKWIVDRPEESYLLDYDDLTKVSESYYSYNEFGDLISSEYWLGSGENPIVQYSYNSYGNLVSETDPNGHTTQYEYDPTYTFVVKGINAKNQETSYEYELGTGNLLSVTDPNGYIAEYVYDMFGRVLKEILPYDSEDSPTVEYVYDFDGIAPEGVIVRDNEDGEGTLDSYYFYDGFGNMIQSKSESEGPEFITNDFYYDELLRLDKESNPYYSGEGYTNPDNSILKTTYEFDVLGRTTKVINPDNTEVNMNYDHWVTSAYDENNHRTDYVNDAYDNIEGVREYAGSDVYTTTYGYDATGNLIRIQDNEGNIVRYTYDTLGRKTGLVDPDLGSWGYRYDSAGNLLEQTDAKGNTISMSYDELDRVLSKSTSSFAINYIYDISTIGTLSRVESSVETTYYDYDARLRKIRERKAIDGIEFTTEWTYDSMDRVTSKTLPDGTIMEYGYNKQGMLESLSDVISSMGYNENGMVTDRVYSNLLSTTFGYDPENYRLLSIETANLQDVDYGYDNVGNILTIGDSVSNLQDTMDYDDRDQLVNSERRDSGGNTIYDIVYSYDSIGNMLELDHGNYQLQFSYDLGHAPKRIDIVGELDLDGDGVADLEDDCPNTPAGESVNTQGCSCTDLADDINDNNECTTDSCENGIITHANKPAGTSCGIQRNCPADTCIGDEWYNYPDDGHDTCNSNAQCIEYSCTTTGVYDTRCDTDDDDDGVPDTGDQCPNTLAGETVNTQGCSCTDLADDINDNNECTTDSCENGIITHANKPAGTSCGIQRNCPADTCIGDEWYNYPDDGHDTCNSNAQCIEYSCTTQGEYSADCDTDDDDDGVPDTGDQCPNTLAGETVNTQGCSCTDLASQIDDNNDCTTDSCSNGIITHANKPAGTSCGIQRNCPADTCIGDEWYNYPDDGHDTCNSNAQCIEYSCTTTGVYDTRCDTDDDDDGVPDTGDQCPNTLAGEVVDTNGCSCEQKNYCIDDDPCTIDLCDLSTAECINEYEGDNIYYIQERACCPNEDDCVDDEDECTALAEGVNTNELCVENNEFELCNNNDDKITSIDSQNYCCLRGRWNLGICGDFDNSGCVDFADFVAFAQAFGTREGDAGYDPKYDLSNNQIIDFEDFLLFAERYNDCA